MAGLHSVELPGLDGRKPLGFLAALGLMRLFMYSVRLSWTPDCRAVLHSTCRSVDEIVDKLLPIVEELKGDQVLRNAHGFPPRRRPGGPDPLRVRSGKYVRLGPKSVGGGDVWLRRIVSFDFDDAHGYRQVSQYVETRGEQSIGSIFYCPKEEVRQDPRRLITEALSGWRRVEGSEAWLLDHEATYDYGPHLRGPAGSRGVPGATWLATYALGTFEFGRDGLSTYWIRVDGRPLMLWPLWSLPTSENTLAAVLNVGWDRGSNTGHWPVRHERDRSLVVQIAAEHLVADPNNIDLNADLGVIAMCAAERSLMSGMPGPLTPAPIRTEFMPPPWPFPAYYRR
jgi:hypothetical protein